MKKLFESLLQNYQKDLEKSIREIELKFDSVDLLSYNLQKTSLKKGWSSPEWLKNNKAPINPKNNDNNYFKYALTVALNHQKIEKNPQIISFYLERNRFSITLRRLEKVWIKQ